jgi:DNA-binding NarL/FixJ family response regulator
MAIATKDSLPSPAAKPYRIVIADDHSIFRRGLRDLLARQPGLEVCGEASTGVQAVNLVRKTKPNLAILDLTMPEMNGIDAARSIREESPETDVLVLSAHFSEELAREAVRAGALGYVLKTDAEGDLLAAVDHMRHRQTFFTSRLATYMMQTFIAETAAATGNGERGMALTPREIEVLQSLADGKSNKEVAYYLKLSTRTVESHRNHIMHKMGFRSFSHLVRFAVRNNLVEP